MDDCFNLSQEKGAGKGSRRSCNKAAGNSETGSVSFFSLSEGFYYPLNCKPDHITSQLSRIGLRHNKSRINGRLRD